MALRQELTMWPMAALRFPAFCLIHASEGITGIYHQAHRGEPCDSVCRWFYRWAVNYAITLTAHIIQGTLLLKVPVATTAL